jgi:hypothetical protein
MYDYSIHRAIGTIPAQVDRIFISIKLKHRESYDQKLKFKVNEKLRVSTQKGVKDLFTKLVDGNIYCHKNKNKTTPLTYMSLEPYLCLGP